MLFNIITNYADINNKFKERFKNKNLIVNENIFRKIKSDTLGIVNNKTIEDICKSLKINNINRIIEIYPVTIETKNKKNEIMIKEQDIIIIAEKEMIKYLDDKKAKLYGLDFI